MTQTIAIEQLHRRYCPVKNTTVALLLVGFFLLLVCVAWRGLHNPAQHWGLVELPFFVLVMAICAYCLRAFKCFRERLVLGLVMACIVGGAIAGFSPSITFRSVESIRLSKLILEVICLIVSFSLLVSSMRNPNIGASAEQMSGGRLINRALLAVFMLVLAILLLGTLLYLWPPR